MKPSLPIFSAVLACALLAGCARRQEVITIGIDVGYKPWNYIDAERGEHTGFDVELALAACEKVGMRPIFRQIVWDQKKEFLYEGKIDCIWSNFTITGREADYAVLGPYSVDNIVVFTRDGSGITNYAGLAGKTVIVHSGSTCESLVSPGGEAAELGATFGEIIRVDNTDQCLVALLNGVADAMVSDSDFIQSYTNDTRVALRVVDGAPLRSEYIGIGFRKGDTELRDRFAAAIKSLDSEGLCARLSEKYFGDPCHFHWMGK